MVCEKCEAKLGHHASSSTWKAGSSGAAASSASSSRRSVGGAGPARTAPPGSASRSKASGPLGSKRCSACSGALHHAHALLCQACAYKGGKCSLCGCGMVDVSKHRMSSK